MKKTHVAIFSSPSFIDLKLIKNLEAIPNTEVHIFSTQIEEKNPTGKEICLYDPNDLAQLKALIKEKGCTAFKLLPILTIYGFWDEFTEFSNTTILVNKGYVTSEEDKSIKKDNYYVDISNVTNFLYSRFLDIVGVIDSIACENNIRYEVTIFLGHRCGYRINRDVDKSNYKKVYYQDEEMFYKKMLDKLTHYFKNVEYYVVDGYLPKIEAIEILDKQLEYHLNRAI